jgi:hypothetical protein
MLRVIFLFAGSRAALLDAFCESSPSLLDDRHDAIIEGEKSFHLFL